MHTDATAVEFRRMSILAPAQRLRSPPAVSPTPFTSDDEAESNDLNTLKVEQRSVRRNAHITRSGDRLSQVFTVISGWAMRYRLIPDGRRQVLGIYLPGDTLGFETILGKASDSSVLAITAMSYTVLNRELIRKYTEEKTWFRDRLFNAFMSERHAVDDWAVCLGQLCAEERIASLFLDLYIRLQARGFAGRNTFQMELTQHQIADTVGLTQVHTNRVLQRLRARKILFLTDQKVVIADLPALQSLAPLAPNALM